MTPIWVTFMLTPTQKLIRKNANKQRARTSQRFFKTGKGQYGEGDIFVGGTAPQLREIAKKSKNISWAEIKKLLSSPIHEDRLVALRILVFNFEKEKSALGQKRIFDFYLKNRSCVNNWDLVDLSAPKIVGAYLFSARPLSEPQSKNETFKNILYKLAKSKSLWDRRIAIISTFYFIDREKFSDTLKIAKILLKDNEDLIHKAVGWMLREIGKRNEAILKKFLRENYFKMSRTTLRYSIERFSAATRKKYLAGKF